MDGGMLGAALVAALGLTLLAVGTLARHDDRFWTALVRHAVAQRRLQGRLPHGAAVPVGAYHRDRRAVGLALLGSGWLVLLLGLAPLLGAALNP